MRVSEVRSMAECADAVEVDEDSYDEARDECAGWCPACEAFTTDVVGPLSAGQHCAECGDDRVSGATHARRAGFICVERAALK